MEPSRRQATQNDSNRASPITREWTPSSVVLLENEFLLSSTHTKPRGTRHRVARGSRDFVRLNFPYTRRIRFRSGRRAFSRSPAPRGNADHGDSAELPCPTTTPPPPYAERRKRHFHAEHGNEQNSGKPAVHWFFLRSPRPWALPYQRRDAGAVPSPRLLRTIMTPPSNNTAKAIESISQVPPDELCSVPSGDGFVTSTSLGSALAMDGFAILALAPGPSLSDKATPSVGTGSPSPRSASMFSRSCSSDSATATRTGPFSASACASAIACARTAHSSTPT